jgi:hypothetical protein
MSHSLLLLVVSFLFIDDLAAAPATGAAGAPQLSGSGRSAFPAGVWTRLRATSATRRSRRSTRPARAARDYPFDVYLAIGGFSGKAPRLLAARRRAAQ